jgi:hypothetical protein
MATVKLSLEVPVEVAGAVFAAVAEALSPEDGKDKGSTPTGGWDQTLATQAIAAFTPFERRLLRRLVDARGQRVPFAELSADLGLPAAPSTDEDFPQLTAFCAEEPTKRPFPIVSGGSGDTAWYWMSVVDAAAFAFAFDPPTKITAPA